jgi:serine/threonine-protein kinase
MGPSDATPRVDPPSPDAHLLVDGTLAEGTMVGELRIESQIGFGGMSTVYSAIQPLIGKRAAIKVIAAHLCVEKVNVDRFVQEARAANQIGHPNIVDAFAFGVLADGRSYLVMEWLQGETLAARLRRGPMPIAEAMAIIFQICDALAAVHEKGIVHRDLKPENVFLVPVRNRRLMVKLLDFGVAKLRGPRGESTVDHTSPGATVGTPKYMAPEQARGSREVDYRADVYALGVTAYEMFTGRVPFVGNEALDIMHQHVYAMPPAPSSLRPELPLQIERLLLQMLEKRADKRPTLMQVEARLADVRDAMALQPPPAEEQKSAPSNRWPTAPRPHEPTDLVAAVAKRRWPLGWPLTLLVLAAGASVGAALYWWSRAPIATTAPAAAAAARSPAAATPRSAACSACSAPAAAAGRTSAAPPAAPRPAAPRSTRAAASSPTAAATCSTAAAARAATRSAAAAAWPTSAAACPRPAPARARIAAPSTTAAARCSTAAAARARSTAAAAASPTSAAERMLRAPA